MSRITICLLLIVVSIGFLIKPLQRAIFIPIEVVSITNKLQYAEPESIKKIMQAHTKAGFFALSPDKVRNELKNIPWVQDASVVRSWPHTVKLNIVERQPLAIWQERGIVDTEAVLFFPENMAKIGSLKASLPEFVGDAAEVNKMVDTYKMILVALKPIGLGIKKLELMSDHGWRAMLDNEVIIILGQTELEERLARLALAYKSVIGTELKVKIIDLRYTNGLAVG